MAPRCAPSLWYLAVHPHCGPLLTVRLCILCPRRPVAKRARGGGVGSPADAAPRLESTTLLGALGDTLRLRLRLRNNTAQACQALSVSVESRTCRSRCRGARVGGPLLPGGSVSVVCEVRLQGDEGMGGGAALDIVLDWLSTAPANSAAGAPPPTPPSLTHTHAHAHAHAHIAITSNAA